VTAPDQLLFMAEGEMYRIIDPSGTWRKLCRAAWLPRLTYVIGSFVPWFPRRKMGRRAMLVLRHSLDQQDLDRMVARHDDPDDPFEMRSVIPIMSLALRRHADSAPRR
jgi:hypothetical protein